MEHIGSERPILSRDRKGADGCAVSMLFLPLLASSAPHLLQTPLPCGRRPAWRTTALGFTVFV